MNPSDLDDATRRLLAHAQQLSEGPTAEELLKTPKVQAQMKMLRITMISGCVLMLLGACILAWNAGWLVMLAVVLIVMGNNSISNGKIGMAIVELTAKILPMIR